MILAIDTTLEKLSIAIKKDGETYTKTSKVKKNNAEILLPEIRDLFNELKFQIKDIKKILVALGPGSYTGIRVGISAALGLKNAIGSEIYGISTLRAMSYQCENQERAVMINARRNTVYAGIFIEDQFVELNGDISEIVQKYKLDRAIGQNLSEFSDIFSREIESDASNLIRAYEDGFYFKEIEAHYLRQAHITTKVKQ